ncbi:FbpB family small basic protein [Bacillus coreaensis]
MRRKLNFKELVSENKKELENNLQAIEKIEIKIENSYYKKNILNINK